MRMNLQVYYNMNDAKRMFVYITLLGNCFGLSGGSACPVFVGKFVPLLRPTRFADDFPERFLNVMFAMIKSFLRNIV